MTLDPRMLGLHQPLRLRVLAVLLRLRTPCVKLRRFQAQIPRHGRRPVLGRPQQRLQLELRAYLLALPLRRDLLLRHLSHLGLRY